MTPQYLQTISKLYPDLPDRHQRFAENYELLHAILGMAGETGEVVDLIKKCVAYGQPFPTDKLCEEFGDVLHYITIAMSRIGITPEQAMQANITKLARRFPTGYTNEAAINREDKK